MKNIVVADFDDTLLPYDSERYYILNEIKKGNLKIIFYAILRKLRILNHTRFAECLYNEMKNKDLTLFVDKLFADINQDILQQVLSYKDENTELILLSASPSCYIKKIAERLHFKGIGSDYFDNLFIHLYADNKALFIQMNYPKSEYRYKFSISDSKSDLTLLRLFEEYELIEKNKQAPTKA